MVVDFGQVRAKWIMGAIVCILVLRIFQIRFLLQESSINSEENTFCKSNKRFNGPKAFPSKPFVTNTWPYVSYCLGLSFEPDLYSKYMCNNSSKSYS